MHRTQRLKTALRSTENHLAVSLVYYTNGQLRSPTITNKGAPFDESFCYDEPGQWHLSAARALGLDRWNRLALTRLRDSRSRVRLVTASFAEIDDDRVGNESFDVVFSSYALHHLGRATKTRVIGSAVSRLKTGGWFLNADLVSSPYAEIEDIIQSIRAHGIESRNAGADPRFCDAESIRAFLDGLEEREGDQPLTLEEDLGILRHSGIANATVFWQEYREVVCGGCKGHPPTIHTTP